MLLLTSGATGERQAALLHAGAVLDMNWRRLWQWSDERLVLLRNL